MTAYSTRDKNTENVKGTLHHNIEVGILKRYDLIKLQILPHILFFERHFNEEGKIQKNVSKTTKIRR
jgi:hypothetical protein